MCVIMLEHAQEACKRCKTEGCKDGVIVGTDGDGRDVVTVCPCPEHVSYAVTREGA